MFANSKGLPVGLEIKKLSYSSGAWRLLLDGEEVYHTKEIDHPHLGKTRVRLPVCADTKTALIEEVLKLTLELRKQYFDLMTKYADLKKVVSQAEADIDTVRKALGL